MASVVNTRKKKTMERINGALKKISMAVNEAFRTMGEVFEDWENANVQEFTVHGITTKTVIEDDTVVFYINDEKVYETNVNDRKQVK